MSARPTIACLLALAATLLAAAPAAASSPSPSVPQLLAGAQRLNADLALMGQGSTGLLAGGDRALSELRFRNSDGFTISVVASGQTVALSVSRSQLGGSRPGGKPGKVRKRSQTTTYLAHGRVTPTSIAASFGDRGRISVRFRPSGREVHASRKAGCRRSGGPSLAELGVFSGELRFQGEGGYTSAEVHRVPGRSIDPAALRACLIGASSSGSATLPGARPPFGIRLPGPVGGRLARAPRVPAVPTNPSTGPESTTLLADRKLALDRTVFAAQMRGKGSPRFLAMEEASEGSIGVVRVVYARGAPGSFAADRILSSASVSPPAPFAGDGKLQRGPGNARSWTGPLAVSFLGEPRVPLTGAPFGAWLSRGF
ncbi:MAG TPA: hypothetical protein VFN89_01115 [Solirubrobacterales bacterium]|nr:hypothetical protein [Solirubrobacterales bacterium]